MDFMDKVKSTFSSVVKVSEREGKKLYEVSKLKVEITNKKNKKKALFKEIGLLAYKAHKSGEGVENAIAAQLGELDVLDEEIASLRDKVKLVKDTDEIDSDGFSEEDEAEIEAEIYEVDVENDPVVDEEPETEPIDPIE